MRVYTPLGHDDQLSYFKLKEFFGKFSFVDLCNVTQVFEVHNITRPIFPMTWRFLPLMDPLVDRILSRDSDTIISKREVTAVRQWLNNSTATFHLMRDHQLHCAPSRTFLGGI